MFSPSKSQEYTQHIARKIERMSIQPHKRFFLNEFVQNNRLGQPLQRIDQEDLIWKNKRNHYKENNHLQYNYISPKKRSHSQISVSSRSYESRQTEQKNQELYAQTQNNNPQVSDRRASRQFTNDLVSSWRRESIPRDHGNIIAHLPSSQKTSPLPVRKSQIFSEPSEKSSVSNASSRQHTPINSHRFKNTNILLGENESSQNMPADKGIKTFKDAQPSGARISHLQDKTSESGFNHVISYPIKDRSRENSLTTSRVFNIGGLDPNAIPSNAKGKRTYGDAQMEVALIQNPVTGQNFKEEKKKGIKILGGFASSKKIVGGGEQQLNPDFILRQLQENNPIIFTEQSNDANSLAKQQHFGRKVNTNQSPSPIKYILGAKENTDNMSQTGYVMHKKLVDTLPKSNIPSINNAFACSSSQLYANKYKGTVLTDKNQKGAYGFRNQSPNILDVFNLINYQDEQEDCSTCYSQIKDQENQSQIPKSQCSNKDNISCQNEQIPLREVQEQPVVDAVSCKNNENSNYSVAGSVIGDQRAGKGKQLKKPALEKCANTGVNSQVQNFGNMKQAVKMGEISGVKKIYDYESFKNSMR